MSGIVGQNPNRGSGVVGATAIADESIDSDAYIDASIDNAHLADDAVGIDELSATGTASSSTFLRGDNSWVTPTDTNTDTKWDGGTTGLTASTGRTSLGLVISTNVQAYDADTAKTDTVDVWTAGQAGEITALSDGATITVDFALSNNFSVTLGGNRTLGDPSNEVAGQSGSIFITQDGTGSQTLAYHANWHFVGGTVPTLTTTADAVDRIDYVIRTTSSIQAVASLDVKTA